MIYLKQVYTVQSNQIKFENRKFESQIKAHLSDLANSYFYNYKPSPRIPRQHRVL